MQALCPRVFRRGDVGVAVICMNQGSGTQTKTVWKIIKTDQLLKGSTRLLQLNGN